MQQCSKKLMLLGRCVPCIKQNASKFLVKRLVLDESLLKYFREEEEVFAHDPDKLCKTGDIALLRLLPSKMTRLITHRVVEVVYPMGDITDPLTGKKVVGGQFRDHMKHLSKVYGELPSSFDYEKAPQRGWQEGKKDFSHKETYVKYHEFEDDDQPQSL